jgi:hypothetical protein
MLASGGTAAREALAIDYFSPYSFQALFAAWRRRHWVVAIAIEATWALQLGVVFSTSLLERELQPWKLPVDNLVTTANLMASTDFSWSNTNDGDLFNAIVMANSSASGLSMSLPSGTTKSIVFQPVQRPDKELADSQYEASALRGYTANVKYFQPGISCQPLHEKLEFQIPIVVGNKTYSIDSGGSHLDLLAVYEDMRWPPESDTARMVGNINVTRTTPDGKQQSYLFQTPVKYADESCAVDFGVYQFGCGGSKVTSDIPWGTFGGRQDCEPGVWLLNTYECRDKAHTVSNFSSTLLECRPNNKHGDAVVRFGSADDAEPAVLSLTEKSDETDARFGGNLIELVFYGAANAVFSAGIATNLVPLLKYTDYADPEQMLNFSAVYSSIQARYPDFANQVFRVRFFQPATGTTSGSIEVFEERLTVQTVTFAILIAQLGLVAVGCMYLMKGLAGPSLVPRDPASMVGTLVAMARTPTAAATFDTCRSGTWRTGQTHDEAKGWWRPWGASHWSRWVTVAIVAGLVVLIEITFQKSNRDGGIAVADAIGLTHFAWTLVPASVINGVALLILCLEFNFRIFQPYVRLAGGGPSARYGLFESQIFGLLPTRLWRLLRRPPQIGLALVTCSTVFAALSSIIVGDLFLFSGAPSQAPGFQLVQLDGFDTQRQYNWTQADSSLGGASNLGSILSYSVLKMAAFTTETYALPRLALRAPVEASAAANRSVTVVVPAARSSLNCSIIPTAAAQCTESQVARNSSAPKQPCTERVVDVPGEYRLPSCGLPGTMKLLDQQAECFFDTSRFGALDGDSRGVCNDEATACFNLRKTKFVGSIWTWYDHYHEPNRYPGCPGLVSWGLQDFSSCGASRLSYAACNPYVEVVDVEATLSVPELAVLAVRPVAGGGASAPPPPRRMNIVAPSDVMSAWSSAIFGTRESKQPTTLYPTGREARDFLSSQMEAMTTPGGGQAPITMDEYTGTDDASRRKVLAALEAQWARSAAQLSSRALKTDTPPGDAPVVVDGVLTDYGRRWVVQDEFSTRLLQGLYGALLLCLVSGLAVRRSMSRVLPFPPTSIGATVRLLGSSGLLAEHVEPDGTVRMPEGAEGMNDRQLVRADTFGLRGKKMECRWWEKGEIGREAVVVEEEEKRSWWPAFAKIKT